MGDFKVIVFFPTARQTGFFSEALDGLKGLSVYEMHSRKSQPYRTKVCKQFREAQNGVMCSSDVSARGLDYPNVTHVFQVGVPSSRQQYIHRLGRTARAGQSGQCVLLMHKWEAFFYRQIKDVKIKGYPGGVPECPWAEKVLTSAVDSVSEDIREKCWSARLGYYNALSKKIGWSKSQLVKESYEFADKVLRLRQKPRMMKKTRGKMGLKGVNELLVK